MKTGDCRWVHGRFAVYNGTPSQRIWIVGTKRIVTIGDDDSNVPAVIRAYERGGPFLRLDDSLFADFRLCALEDNRPGRMQHIHIAEVRDPRFRGQPFRPSPKEP